MKLINKLLTVAILLFVCSASSFWAQSDWTVEQIANGENAVIDVEPDGDVHIVYQYVTYSGKGKNRVSEDHLIYNVQTNGVWGDPVELGQQGFAEHHPSIDVVNGVAHVVFTNRIRDESNTLSGVVYYWNSSIIPIDLVAINNYPNEIDFPNGADIAVNKIDGRIHIALSATHTCCVDGGDQSNIYYTSSSDGITFDPIVNLESKSNIPFDNRGSRSPSIDIDESGNVGILFTTYWIHDGGENTYSISYTNNSSSSFFIPEILVEGGFDIVGLLEYPPLKLADGIAHLLYNRYNEGNPCGCPGYQDLLFAKLDAESGALLDNPIVVAQGIDFTCYSMDYEVVIDGSDKLHNTYVSYYNAGTEKKPNWKREIRYLQLNAETGAQLFPFESIGDGYDPQIVVSTDGTANISFTNDGDIFYITNNGTSQEPGGVLHVSNIEMDTEVNRGKWNAVADVFVVDAGNQSVSGVLVTGNWSGRVSGTNSATTDAEGMATIKSGKTKKNGTITFTVTNIEKAGWTYDIEANFANPASGEISSPLGKQIAENEEPSIPDNYALFNNYPNPFNPSTKIKYSIPQKSYVTLNIYDVLGKTIASLVNQNQQPGYYEIDFDASKLANDVYFYILKAGEFVETKKMIFLK